MKYVKTLIVLCTALLLYPKAIGAEDHVYEEVVYQDVTGDKLKDRIILSGTFDEKDPQMLTDVQLRIFVKSSKDYMEFDLADGAKPKMAFTDINQDGIKDLLVTIHPAGEAKEAVKGYALTVKGSKLHDLEIPDPVAIESCFNNGYTATLTIGQKSVEIDMKAKKDQYEELGIYQNGKLNEPMEMLIGTYSSLKPVYTVRGKGIEGVQRVSGAFEDDLVGEIRSVWLMDGSGWKLEKVFFKKNVK